MKLTIDIKTLKESDLTEEQILLVESAKRATYNSYSPYSHFSVGVSLLLDNGTIINGSNQENVAYPSGTCAERTALFYAGSQYHDNAVVILCIAARATDGAFTTEPISPCGACRQVMIETENRQKLPMQVILYGTEKIYLVSSASDLMPLSFSSF